MGDVIGEVLFAEAQIRARVREMAQEITAILPAKDLLLVAVLKGSLFFLVDLCRELPAECEIEFMQVSSYHGGTTSSGDVQIRKDLDVSIEGRDVLIVEDIVDSGATLSRLLAFLGSKGPRSLSVVTLLSKARAKGIDVPAMIVGFEIPDEFVVGYGLDYGERYRGLPYISILREADRLP